MIKKFRKKPIVIEAIQWDGNPNETFPEISRWTDMSGEIGLDPTGDLIILTLEGNMRASVGDWIIKGVGDEFYPCKPDIFQKTYEEVIEAAGLDA